MQLLILILKEVELTNELMKKLAESGVKGGTTIDGNGMASALINIEDLPMFGMLRNMLVDEEKEACKVMLFILQEEQVAVSKEIIRKVIGPLNTPNTGIMFTIPINEVEGFGE